MQQLSPFLRLMLSYLKQVDPALRQQMLRELGWTEARFAEQHHWRGAIQITHRALDGRLIKQAEFRNTITSVGHNLLRDVLQSAVTDGGIHYVAVGTDNTAPAAGQTQLGAEIYRQQLTSQSTGGTGVGTSICIIGPTSAIATWQEIGWFAGASAGPGANTGIMIARVLYNHNHTNAESVQISRQETIS